MSLPEGWRETTLGEVVEVIGGGTPKTSISEYWNGDIPWLSVVDFNNTFRWVDSTEKGITELGLKNSSTKLLDKGDLIISARGTVGALAQLKKEMAFNQSCYGIKEINNISNKDFLYYLIQFSLKQISSKTHGAVFDTITRQTFDDIYISFPPLQEQKAIANILSSFDEKIELLKEQNETLEQMAQGVFREWFVDGVDESWEIKTLGSIGKVVTGKTPSTKKEEYWGDDLLFITPTDFKNYGKFTFSSIRFLSKDGKEKMKKSILPKDSILVTCIGSDMGKVVISTSECLTNQQINSLILDDNYMIEYTYQYLKSIYTYLRNIALGGSTMPIINKSSFEEIEITVPAKELLIKYNSIVNVLNEKLKNNTEQIQTLQKTRNTLLPKLMSGEVRVV